MENKSRPVFAIFGGTFNPIHKGHVGLVRGLLERGEANRVLVVPAARNPFKGEGYLLPASLRLAMARQALEGIAGASVLDIELRRGDPSYTVDTVSALRSVYPEARLKLVMGWDVFLQFPEWHCAADIVACAELLVVLRQGAKTPPPRAKGEQLAGLPEQWRSRVRRAKNGAWQDEQGRPVLEFSNLRLPAVSASKIRERRDLRDVPEAARKMLADFWRTEDESQ